jgi:DNA-directed RNA polymerase specialized sigma24 family protein
MQISQGILLRHFPSDNRFIHYTLRKKGRVVREDETILSVRHIALVQVLKAVNKEKEFESEAHITNYIMTAIDMAYCNVLRDSNLLKNNLPIRSYSDYTDDNQMNDTTLFDGDVVTEDYYDNTIDHILGFIESVSTPLRYEYFTKRYLEGYSATDIAEHYGVTQQAVSFQLSRVKEDIKKNIHRLDI